MYKELLGYLLGYRGSFLVEGQNGEWCLHNSLPVDEGTRYLASEILELGRIVRSIKEFVDAVSEGSVTVGVKSRLSDKYDENIANTADKVYSSALCEGVTEVLLAYEDAVNSLYREASCPSMSVSQIRGALSQWFDIIPSINNMIQEVKHRPAQILTTLDTAVKFGSAREHLLTILKKCNTILLKHISVWVVWGSLPRQPGFFIEDVGSNNDEVVSELVPLFLPSFIPSQLAKMILTIGQYSRKISDHPLLSEDAFVLHRCLVSDEVIGNGQINVSLLEDLLVHTEQIVGYSLWKSVYSGVGQITGPEQGKVAIPLDKHLEAMGDFLLCFKGDFWRTFTTTALNVVATSAIRSVGYRGGIVDLRHAARIRDNIVARFNMACATHNTTSNECFSFIHFSCTPDDTAYAKLLEPATHSDSEAAESIRISNFILATTKSISLEYKLPSPVNDLFCDQCYDILRSIYSHTMYVLFTEILLYNSWKSCMAVTKKIGRERMRGFTGDASVAKGVQLLKPLLILWRKMNMFLSNLKLYIMTDVVHSKFASLQETLKSAKTFDSAKQTIKKCLQEIARDAFLIDPDKSNHMVLLTIRLVVRCCLQLWYIVHHSMELDGRNVDYYRAMVSLSKKASVLSDIGHTFDRHVKDLYEILSRNPQVNKYKRLLTRLNFNHYWGL
eukprot:TRINITY_DN17055_c0_g1_i1.p1 TRINITY_DN17055_c0_g1~~TRINITY_DN17055_c0_g1_i1.p1  ORF type:complete len:671 (+),score=121.42 TRINITY_DN17055_c0_g1_i1:76-2088(+)